MSNEKSIKKMNLKKYYYFTIIVYFNSFSFFDDYFNSNIKNN